jgi:hypothetical protein
MRFWSMPGPVAFIDEVLEAAAEGLNVAIAMPSGGSAGFEAALLDRLRQRVVESMWVAGDAAPAAEIARAMGIPEAGAGIDELFGDPRFSDGTTICIQGLTEAMLPQWRRFIADYDDLSKDRPVGERPVMITVLEGMDLPDEVREAVTFRGLRWLGRASELDFTQYVLERLEYAPDNEGGRLLAAMIVAKVALGDVELAEDLASRVLDEIWAPEPVLRDAAGKRGWLKGTHRHWTKGTVYRVDGRDEVHSALMVLDDPGCVVRSRVWAAQAAMLLPAIERERRKLVSRARNWLKPPFYLLDGESVADADDLEIGPLEYQLRRGKAPAELVRRAADLKELRNKLAHMEPLTVEESLYSGLL